MCIRITFGCSERELAMRVVQAKQALVEAFRQGIRSNLLVRIPDEQALRRLLNQPYVQAPERWAEQAAVLLARAISQLHLQAVQAEAEVEQLRRKREARKKQPEQRTENPRQEEVQALARERNHWQDAANRWRTRAKEVEEALARAQQAQQFQQGEIDRLQEEVEALNRLIVEQQEQINALAK